MSSSGRPMRKRKLARTLQQWRSAANMSGDAVARALLCGTGTISRMENAETADPLRVRAALELYGAPRDVIDEMVQIAVEGRKRTRNAARRPYGDVEPKALAEYYELEDEADSASMLEGEVVPGLIQTPGYARALIAAGEPPEDVDRLVDIRMQRQERRLKGSRPLRYRVALGEAALLNQVGGKEILRGQLEFLIELATHAPHVEIRMLPFAAGARPAIGRNFTILSFEDESEPDLIFAESVTYFVLEDEIAEVEQFRDAYNEIWEKALSEADSVRMMQLAASQL